VRFLGTIWHKSFSSPILHSVSNERFPGSSSLHQRSFWLNLRSNRISSLTPAVLSPVSIPDGHPLRCSSSTRILPSENIFFLPAKGLCFWHCIISKGLLNFSMCCGRIVTEFNTERKDGIPLRDVPCFHFHDEIHKHLLTCQAPTPHWGNSQQCHCNWGWRKDQGQRLSVLADCGIASTARRKLVSLLYCRTTYIYRRGLFMIVYTT